MYTFIYYMYIYVYKKVGVCIHKQTHTHIHTLVNLGAGQLWPRTHLTLACTFMDTK